MFTTKELLARIGKGVKSSAKSSVKVANETRTTTLRTLPRDMGDDDYIDSANTGGIDYSLSIKSEDGRTKSATGREIFGKAAVELTADTLGVTLKPAKTPKGEAAPAPSPAPATV